MEVRRDQLIREVQAGEVVRMPRSFTSVVLSDSGMSIGLAVLAMFVAALGIAGGEPVVVAVAATVLIIVVLAAATYRVTVGRGQVVWGFPPFRRSIDLTEVDDFMVLPLSEMAKEPPLSIYWTANRPDESWKWNGASNRGRIGGSGLLGPERRNLWLAVLRAAKASADASPSAVEGSPNR